MAPHRAGPQEPEGTTMSDKMKTKIELLLAKAEGTDNEHERDAYTAKAQRLMLEWGIEEADLEARGEVKAEEIVEERRTYSGSYAAAYPSMAHAMARAMGGLRTLKAGSGSRWSIYVIGHKTDVEHFLALWDSIVRQAEVGQKSWWATAPERAWLGRQEGWKARRQFYFSFGQTVATRLHGLRDEVQAEATPGAALVLVSKDERVEDDLNRRYPSLRKGRSLEGSGYGGAAGRAAGMKANIGNSVGGSARGAIR
jgi:hypothetical protein